MPSARTRSLWIQIAWPFLLFVLAGSIALTLWMRQLAQRESHAAFAALAATNADFIRASRIPATEQMMRQLGQLLNLEAFLVRQANPFLNNAKVEVIPSPAGALEPLRERVAAVRTSRAPVRLNEEHEAISAAINPGVRLVLIRRAQSGPALWRGFETASVLATFCALSVGLAWLVSYNVVHPLRLLAERLPHIGHDREATLPGAERNDEIGQLARAYLETRTQLAKEREQRRQAERMALLGRMATSLAHEIHNPLTAIRMHAQLVESTPSESIEIAAREALPIVLAETVRIEGIVNQWMFLAKPEAPRTRDLALEAVLQRVITSYKALAAHAGVEISTKVEDVLRVPADERRLGQAFANLIVNAVQAMPTGGSLEISANERRGKLELVFEDTGSGFSKVALARGSELFFSEKEGGMGVGLSVTTEILAALGGQLRLSNAPGGGARVTVTLPASPAVPTQSL